MDKTIKPYLFIDVDGVLNPDKGTKDHVPHQIFGLRVYLNPYDGARLRILSEWYDLAWASTWKGLANEHIGPKIGLPKLPFVPFSIRYPTSRHRSGVMVKTEEVVKFTDRPFAWIDDDIMPRDVAYVLANCPHDAKMMWIDFERGIKDKHYDELEKWGREQT